MDISRKNNFELEIHVGDTGVKGTFSNETNDIAESHTCWITYDKGSSFNHSLSLKTMEEIRSMHQALGELIDYLDANKPLVEKK